MVGAAPLVVFALAAPAAAHVSVQQTAASVTTVSAGRIGATSAALLGLLGAVIGGLALARPASRFGTGNGPLGATVAQTAGLIAMAIGGLVVATADGGLGTGNGLGGAIVALMVGLIAVVLGRVALIRSRRTAAPRRPLARP
ncbi:DUF6223 family protein [Streptomyces sp. E11-3]|uniref:DUF6223 family protein n=1 Tax=Streptomyces sp. E11-3 TaxID=3110112 RepID=UPI00397EF920